MRDHLKKTSNVKPLTRRELEVTALVTEGKSNKEIGAALGMADQTVKFHVSNACKKIGTSSRVVLAVKFALSQRAPAPDPMYAGIASLSSG